jgi:hypothetical protein
MVQLRGRSCTLLPSAAAAAAVLNELSSTQASSASLDGSVWPGGSTKHGGAPSVLRDSGSAPGH